ncbi:hypothetical protein LX97_00109 [Nonlabens dokdonensis]|uniref:Uncharacterized protein n=2 Tax=Nonlabens dokdonensis TaxID=328515 RepID=A0ABX5PZE5_9FLAO|nr:hypothetical protein [Nonlabens dokdonensis]PZX43110.1 hypothetical protein LX97_00109 [Nonlabens dokdonensis]
MLGSIQTTVSVFWSYHMIVLYYQYHFTNIAFAFMYPDWVLFVNILVCAINIYFGIKLIRKRESLSNNLLFLSITIAIGFITNNFYYMV